MTVSEAHPLLIFLKVFWWLWPAQARADLLGGPWARPLASPAVAILQRTKPDAQQYGTVAIQCRMAVYGSAVLVWDQSLQKCYLSVGNSIQTILISTIWCFSTYSGFNSLKCVNLERNQMISINGSRYCLHGPCFQPLFTNILPQNGSFQELKHQIVTFIPWVHRLLYHH